MAAFSDHAHSPPSTSLTDSYLLSFQLQLVWFFTLAFFFVLFCFRLNVTAAQAQRRHTSLLGSSVKMKTMTMALIVSARLLKETTTFASPPLLARSCWLLVTITRGCTPTRVVTCFGMEALHTGQEIHSSTHWQTPRLVKQHSLSFLWKITFKVNISHLYNHITQKSLAHLMLEQFRVSVWDKYGFFKSTLLPNR